VRATVDNRQDVRSSSNTVHHKLRPSAQNLLPPAPSDMPPRSPAFNHNIVSVTGMIYEVELFPIKDRGQTDRVVALPRSHTHVINDPIHKEFTYTIITSPDAVTSVPHWLQWDAQNSTLKLPLPSTITTPSNTAILRPIPLTIPNGVDGTDLESALCPLLRLQPLYHCRVTCQRLARRTACERTITVHVHRCRRRRRRRVVVVVVLSTTTKPIRCRPILSLTVRSFVAAVCFALYCGAARADIVRRRAPHPRCK